MSSATEASRSGWLDAQEKGTVLGVRFFVWLLRLCGRAVARAFLRPVVLYYVLVYGLVRRASREIGQRLGEPRRSLGRVYRHLRTFAECTLDRFFFVQGRADLYDVHAHGHEHLARLREEGRGAILLGAHLGSFEVMRLRATTREVPIHVVGYFKNARRVNAALEAVGAGARVRLVTMEPGGVSFVLAIKERIRAG